MAWNRVGVTLAAACVLMAPVVTAAPASSAPAPPAPSAAGRSPSLTGWVPYWDVAALDRVAQAGTYSAVSLFGWTVSSVGGQPKVSSDMSAATTRAAIGKLSAGGVTVWATVTDGTSANVLSRWLDSPGHRRTLVSALAQVAAQPGVGGVDVDFENFAFADSASRAEKTRVSYVGFVRELRTRLSRQQDMVSVTVPAATSTSQYRAYDWKAVSANADQVRVMAYDFSTSTPGPIGPSSWWSQVSDYGLTQVGVSKLVMGVAAYGRDWAVRTATGAPVATGVCPDNADVSTLTWSAADAQAKVQARASGPVVWVRRQGELSGTYYRTYTGMRTTSVPASPATPGRVGIPASTVVVPASCTVKRVVWVSDEDTLRSRLRTSPVPLSVWNLGGVSATFDRAWPSLSRSRPLRLGALCVAP